MILPAVTALTVTLGSYHLNPDFTHKPGFHERNPGIVVELDHKWLAGAYVNSFRQVTVLAGRRVGLGAVGGVQFSAFTAAATGYGGAPVSPVAAVCAEAAPVQVCTLPPVGRHAGIVAVNFIRRW